MSFSRGCHMLLVVAAALPCVVVSASLDYGESVNPPQMKVAPEKLLKDSPSQLTDNETDTPTSRPTDYTHEDRGSLIGTHNNHRRQVSPSAANMNALMWDSDLAAMSQGWSDQCLFAHGNPENISPFGSVGQNIYIRWSTQSDPAAPNPATAIDKWHDEVEYYTYANQSCSHVCGHYTQVVWAKTTHFGCGKTFCGVATNGQGKTYNNAWIVTCNYGPAGNYAGQRPYIEGERCTKCGEPSTCTGNLCKDCNLDDSACSCRLDCGSCGYQNTTDGRCECTCSKGFWGDNCDKPCEDGHQYCGTSPGWPNKSYCNRHPSIPKYCPLMCEVCEKADQDSTLTCE